MHSQNQADQGSPQSFVGIRSTAAAGQASKARAERASEIFMMKQILSSNEGNLHGEEVFFIKYSRINAEISVITRNTCLYRIWQAYAMAVGGLHPYAFAPCLTSGCCEPLV